MKLQVPFMNEQNTQELMMCHEIKPGMIFEPCPDGAVNKWRKEPDSKKTWIVLSADERTARRYLFFCSPLDNRERIVLMCFDEIFDKKDHNFRFPDETS